MEVKIIVPDFPNGIAIGEERENLAVPVVVDYTAWIELHGAGALQILLQRPQDADPYPVTVTNDNGEAIWTPNETDMNFKGRGEIQLVYTAGDVIEKSPVIAVISGRSLGVSGDAPDPYETWLESLTELAAETLVNAQNAANSAEEATDAANEAEQHASQAAESAQSADESAQAAEASEQAAGQSAALARTKAAEAAEAAQIAGREADYAMHQSIAAGDSAASAHDSAESAAQSAEDAQAAASAAQTAATAAGAAAADAAATVTEVETKGAEQITAINQAGTTQIAAVDAAGAAQVQAIEDKGEEVIASIPSDYTELADEVSDLKSALDGLENNIYIDGEACAVRSTTDNTALTANGNQTSNTSAEIVTYIVNSGDNIHIIAAGGTAGVFQFSSDSAISSRYRVGETITKPFDGYVTVPETARFLHVSKLKSATGNSVTEYHVAIDSMMDDIHDAMSGLQPIYKIDSNADFVIGRLGSDYHTIVSDYYRVVNSNIVYPDRDIQFTIAPGYQYSICTYDSNGNWLKSDTGFISVNYNVSKGYGFIATIRKYPEQRVIDKYEYLNALQVFTLQGNLVNELSNSAKLSYLVKTPWVQQAHRGIISGTIVENTIASYEEAYKDGFERIECDIRLTLDNEIVMAHDETVSGTVDGVETTYTVATTPWNTLKQLVLADDPVYGEQTVPKFNDVLAWAYYRNVHLQVDFKDRIVPFSDAALLIKRNGMSGKVTYVTNSSSAESSDTVFLNDPYAYIAFAYTDTIIAELNAKNYDKHHIIIWSANPSQAIINEIRDNGYALMLADVYSTANLGYKADIVEYARQTVYEINAINQSFMDSLDY